MLNKKEIIELINKSYKNRLTLLEIIRKTGVAHIGGAFSSMDLMTVLYSKVLRHNPKKPNGIPGIFLYCPQDIKELDTT